MKTYKWLTTAALSLLLLTGCTEKEDIPVGDLTSNAANTVETAVEKNKDGTPKTEGTTGDKVGKDDEREKSREEIEKLQAERDKERLIQMYPEIEDEVAEKDLALFGDRNVRDLSRGMLPDSRVRIGMPIDLAIKEMDEEPVIETVEGAMQYSFGNVHYYTEIDHPRIIRMDYVLEKAVSVDLLEEMLRAKAEPGADGTVLFNMDRTTIVGTMNWDENITHLSIVDNRR